MHQHHMAEAKILLRELEGEGFDCMKLGKHPLFATALSEYGAMRMTRDELFDIAEKLTIFNPALKPATTPDRQ